MSKSGGHYTLASPTPNSGGRVPPSPPRFTPLNGIAAEMLTALDTKSKRELLVYDTCNEIYLSGKADDFLDSVIITTENKKVSYRKQIARQYSRSTVQKFASHRV